MKILLDKTKLNSIEFTNPYNLEYLTDPAGQDHYRILAYLSTLYNSSILYDIGTARGTSAFALSYNNQNKIISYDVFNNNRQVLNHSNIEFRLGNCLLDLKDLLQSPLIMLDTQHDGGFEYALYFALGVSGYKGILVMDDIHLNDAMKAVWSTISHPKYDVTPYGHWSGTGIVCFDNQEVLVRIGDY